MSSGLSRSACRGGTRAKRCKSAVIASSSNSCLGSALSWSICSRKIRAAWRRCSSVRPGYFIRRRPRANDRAPPSCLDELAGQLTDSGFEFRGHHVVSMPFPAATPGAAHRRSGATTGTAFRRNVARRFGGAATAAPAPALTAGRRPSRRPATAGWCGPAVRSARAGRACPRAAYRPAAARAWVSVGIGPSGRRSAGGATGGSVTAISIRVPGVSRGQDGGQDGGQGGGKGGKRGRGHRNSGYRVGGKKAGLRQRAGAGPRHPREQAPLLHARRDVVSGG